MDLNQTLSLYLNPILQHFVKHLDKLNYVNHEWDPMSVTCCYLHLKSLNFLHTANLLELLFHDPVLLSESILSSNLRLVLLL